MAENKTKPTDSSVTDFINAVNDEGKRDDSRALIDLFREVTGDEPKMWGPSIIGFGSYHYVYESGREGDAPLTGFSPRKKELSLYIMAGFSQYDDLMSKLGKHRTGKSCLYVKKLEDIDLVVLRKLVKLSVEYMKKKYPAT